MTTKGKYTRDELARLAASLRSLKDRVDLEAGADLESAAAFLTETVGTLDLQKRYRDRRKAEGIIAAKKARKRSR